MDELEIVAIKKWLTSKSTTLWLNWDLTQPDELEAAAQYWLAQTTEFRDFKMHQASLFASNVEFDVV